MSNEADFDAYDHRQRDAIVADYAEALGMVRDAKTALRDELTGVPDVLLGSSPPLCETSRGPSFMGKNGVPYTVLDQPIPDGPQPDPQATEPVTPSEPLLVGLTLRRIPDGGVLVTDLAGQVMFCCTAVEEALEYVGDRFGVAD